MDLITIHMVWTAIVLFIACISYSSPMVQILRFRLSSTVTKYTISWNHRRAQHLFHSWPSPPRWINHPLNVLFSSTAMIFPSPIRNFLTVGHHNYKALSYLTEPPHHLCPYSIPSSCLCGKSLLSNWNPLLRRKPLESQLIMGSSAPSSSVILISYQVIIFPMSHAHSLFHF